MAKAAAQAINPAESHFEIEMGSMVVDSFEGKRGEHLACEVNECTKRAQPEIRAPRPVSVGGRRQIACKL